MQATKHTSKGIHPSFETQGKHQVQNRGISGPAKSIEVLQKF